MRIDGIVYYFPGKYKKLEIDGDAGKVHRVAKLKLVPNKYFCKSREVPRGPNTEKNISMPCKDCIKQSKRI